MDKETQYDAIIIGGGISGLFLGALLSKQNLKVLVCEKNSHLGGRYREKRWQGFTLSFGFKGNRFARQGYVQELFDLLGEPVEFVCAREILVYEDHRFRVLPRGLKPTLLSPSLSFREKYTFIKLYRQLLSFPPQDYYRITLHEWLSERTQSPNIINLFRYYSQLGLVSPDISRTSMGEFIFLTRRGLTARYPLGVPKEGWGKEMELLKAIIESHGTVKTGCRVRKIIIENGAAKGIECDQEFISARMVITAFPLNPGLFGLIDEKIFPEDWVQNVKRLKPTCGINLDFCLDRRITDEGRTIATHEPYPVTQGIMESNFRPDTAPPGRSYGSWLLLVPYEKFSDRDYLAQQAARLEDLLAEMFPGIWDCCIYKRVMRLPMVNAIAPRSDQSWADKPDFTAPGIGNLFFVGDSTRGQGGGGDITMSSILQVYNLVMALVGKNYEDIVY